MAKRNTHRNKCEKCGEYYKSFHMCKIDSQGRFIKVTEAVDPESWSNAESYIYAEVSGNGYARQAQPFDDWFASIEKYIEGKLAC